MHTSQIHNAFANTSTYNIIQPNATAVSRKGTARRLRSRAIQQSGTTPGYPFKHIQTSKFREGSKKNIFITHKRMEVGCEDRGRTDLKEPCDGRGSSKYATTSPTVLSLFSVTYTVTPPSFIPRAGQHKLTNVVQSKDERHERRARRERREVLSSHKV
jgi:hypothetical protein